MSAIKRWAEVTTCHGIIDLHQSTNICQRFAWAMVIIAAFGTIIYYQTSLVNYYFTTPTATQITKKIVEDLSFPTVTVCNQHIFSAKKFHKVYEMYAKMDPIDFPLNGVDTFMALVTIGAMYFPVIPWTSFGLPYEQMPFEMIKFQLLFNTTLISPLPKYDWLQFLNDTSYDCGDMFDQSDSDCAFGLDQFDCCKDAIPVQGDIGNCYQLRPHTSQVNTSNLKQFQPGVSAGLVLAFSYNSSDGPPFPLIDEGFVINVGDQMTSLDYARITVGPNQKVSVNLALQVYEFDPTITYCVDQSPQLAYTKNGVTSVALCKQECQTNTTLKWCDCVPMFPHLNMPSTKYCTPLQTSECFGVLLRYNVSMRQDAFACQLQNCPKLCQTRLYVPFAVYSTIAPKPQFASRPGMKSAVANIYFGELAYTLIVEKPLMDLAGLISGFGGNLGLFAGMSLITIVQFLAHVIYACGGICKRKSKKVDDHQAKSSEMAIKSDPTELPPVPISSDLYRPIHL